MSYDEIISSGKMSKYYCKNCSGLSENTEYQIKKGVLGDRIVIVCPYCKSIRDKYTGIES